MSNPTVDPAVKKNRVVAMTKSDPAPPSGETAYAAPIKSLHEVASLAKANAEALSEGGTASIAAFQELAQAYQELAKRNAQNVTAAIEALTKVKSPVEFFALQQRLIKEGVDAAILDSQEIGKLTSAVFAAAFEPVKKQIEAVQKTTRK